MFLTYLNNASVKPAQMIDWIISFNTGVPIITYNNGSTHTFSLLPSDTNRAEIEVLMLNVILSVNLVGRWQTPDGSFVLQSSLTVPIFYLSDEGLYRFHVTDWNGEQELAIEIAISVIGK